MLELKISLFLAYLLFCWLQTDAIVQYYLVLQRLFGLTGDKLKVNEYIGSNFRGSYQDYLAEKYKGFWTKLISCNICLGFWLAVFMLFFVDWRQCLAMPFLILVFYYGLVWISRKVN